MKLFTTIIALTITLYAYIPSAHALLGDGVDTKTVGNFNVPAPQDIAHIQLYSNKEIEYMIKNYSTPELARKAIQINKTQTEIAKQNGTELPPRLTKEILSDKEKIAEYLRSLYKFSY